MLKVRKTIVLLVIVMAFAGIFSACGSGKSTSGSYEWPQSGLASLVEKPSSDNGEIYTDGASSFGMKAYKFSADDFSAYVLSCKDKGFIIEPEEKETYYKAYNGDGYELTLNYAAKENRLQLTINAPIEMGTLDWPSEGLAAIIPVPEADIGKIIDNYDDHFFGYLHLEKEDFDAYVEKCIAAGFDKNASQTDVTYRADNADGVHIELIYKGADTVSLGLKLNEGKTAEASEQDEERDEEDNVIVVELSEDEEKILDLIGADALTARNVLEETGFTATYYYDYPNPDMITDYTRTMATFDDEFLQQLFVTRVKDMNGEGKTVSLYVNDVNPNEQAERTSTVSFDMACQAAEQYGKGQYPNGFTLHYIGGMLANQTYADGTVMVKAKCTIKNVHGTKIETICEAKVAGTDDNPKVTYFFVYED